jgi:phosphotransferase system IIA component
MKQIASIFAAVSLSGCAVISTSKFDATTGHVTEKSHTFVLAQKSALKGYKLFQHSGTNGTALNINGLDNQTQADVITAGGEAIGQLVGAAVKAAAK